MSVTRGATRSVPRWVPASARRTAGHPGVDARGVRDLIQDETGRSGWDGTGRGLLTLDCEFGDLVFARSRAGQPGVVYLRLVLAYPTEVADGLIDLVDLIESGDVPSVGMFTVIDMDHLRRRPLPACGP